MKLSPFLTSLLLLPTAVAAAGHLGSGVNLRRLQDAPPNDSCAAAIPLEFVDGISSVAGSTENATLEEITCARSGGPTVWYSLVGNGARFQASTVGSGTTYSSMLVVSNLPCETVGETCVVDSGFNGGDARGETVDWFTEDGARYHIAVTGYYDTRFGSFELTVTESFLPLNDQCDTAQVVIPETSPTTILASTKNATLQELSCARTEGPTVWYSVMGTGARFRASTEYPETNFPAHLVLTDESDCGTVGTTCVDDTGFTGADNRGGTLEWFTTNGTEYKLAVTGYYDDRVGDFGLHILEYTLPSNDKCSIAEEIVPSVSAETLLVASTSNATEESIECARSSGRTVWFSVVGTGARFNVSTQMPETTFPAQLAISERECGFEGDACVAKSNFAGNDNRGDSLEWWTTNGTVYRIAVTGYYVDRFGDFGLALTEYVLPANDKCDAAEPLVPSLSSETLLVASTINATEETIECSSTQGRTVWFLVVGTGARFNISTQTSETTFPAQLIISERECGFEGDTCVARTNFAGSDDRGDSLEWWTTNGTVYKIAVAGYYDDRFGDFGLALTEYLLPTNDKCDLAEPLVPSLSLDTEIFGSLANASADAIDCSFSSGPTIWYSVIGTGARFRISTCSLETTFPTVLVVSQRECDSVGVACVPLNDGGDCGDGILGSSQEWFTRNGTEYKIAVGSFFTAADAGRFALSIMEYVLPPNDACVDAIPMDLDSEEGPSVSGSTANATIKSLECTFYGDQATVWYSFVGNGSTVQATTCSPETLAEHRLVVSQRDCDSVGEVCVTTREVFEACEGGEIGTTVVWDTTEGVEYKIAVMGDYEVGDFVLSLSVAPPSASPTFGLDGGSSSGLSGLGDFDLEGLDLEALANLDPDACTATEEAVTSCIDSKCQSCEVEDTGDNFDVFNCDSMQTSFCDALKKGTDCCSQCKAEMNAFYDCSIENLFSAICPDFACSGIGSDAMRSFRLSKAGLFLSLLVSMTGMFAMM